ncbi:MAG: hypothetical protein NTW69_07920 [Chloroflexi bacterium]|nr:hypothetical protein [Chloroflexota bacterium]
MIELRDLQAKYITDKNGKKTAAILPIEVFEGLLEDLEDLAVLAERRDEPTISHEEVMEKLKRDGFLQN